MTDLDNATMSLKGGGILTQAGGYLRRALKGPADAPDLPNLLDVGDPATRSDFYLKVAIVALVLLGGDLALGWILQFYFGDQIISNISFTGSDPSWIPAGTHFKAALGGHYFGDFEQYMGYVHSRIPPYSTSIVYPAAYGPASIVIVKIFDELFGWPGAVLVFLSVTFLLFTWGLMRLLGSFLSARLLGLLLLFSSGLLVALDRGNLQILVAGLCVWFCVGVLEKRPWVIVASLALAMAIKLYVALLLLALVRQRRWREIGLILVITLGIYAVGFAIVGGSFFGNIHAFIHEDLEFGSQGKVFMLACVSAVSAVGKLLYMGWGLQHFETYLNQTPSWYLQIPGVLAGLVCLGIIWLSRRSWELALVAVLAMMQLTPTATYPYVDINTVVELALLMRVASLRTQPQEDGAPSQYEWPDPGVAQPVLVACIGLLLIASVPWFAILHGAAESGTPMSELVSPVASILMILTLLGGLIFARIRSGRLDRGDKSVVPAPSHSDLADVLVASAGVKSMQASN